MIITSTVSWAEIVVLPTGITAKALVCAKLIKFPEQWGAIAPLELKETFGFGHDS
jgi:hypothetical protein